MINKLRVRLNCLSLRGTLSMPKNFGLRYKPIIIKI